jgi:hypothetical protein
MAFEISGTLKNCATCTSWTGTRKLTKSNTFVEVESPSARGPCGERTRGRIPVSANQTCTKYAPWPMLRR